MTISDDLTEEELAKLAEKGTDEQKSAVARHPNTGLQTLLYLARKGFDEVDQNPLLPLYIEVGSDQVVAILENVAKNTEREQRLEELASSIWNKVRRGVAWNMKTPPATLSLLAKDQHVDVRRGVARNASTPPATLSLLAEDQDEYVRRGVAENASTPPDILSLLAKDQDGYVRLNIAKNANTPVATLSLLAKDEELSVRDAAHETLAKLKKAAR